MTASTIQDIAKVNGADLYYEATGEGHPLILIQGKHPLGLHIWDDQFLPLSSLHRVIRYDTRGIGKSSDPKQPYSDVDDLAGLLQVLGIKKASLLEVGGTIALEFVQKYVSSVDALLLMSVIVKAYHSMEAAMDDELPQILEFYTPIGEALTQNNVPLAIDLLMQDPTLPLPSAQYAYQKARGLIAENIHLFLNPPTPSQITPLVWSFPQEWLENIQVPTLLLRGEQAPLKVCESFNRLIQAIPSAKQQIITGSRYLPNMEQPAVFNHHIMSFLQQIGQ